MILLIGYCANCATVMAEQFPSEVRAAGIAISFAFSVCLFGGTVPYIVTLLDDPGKVALYFEGISVLASVLYGRMDETGEDPLRAY
jgi:MHS family alpha-ketoglutarate permease-like MFS transporter